MSCGPGKGLVKLGQFQEKAKNKFNELKAGANGILDSLDNLAAEADAAISEIAGSLKEMIPEIEFPDITLPELKLPEIKLPSLSLQLEVSSILAKLNSNDPAEVAQAKLNLESLDEKFPDTDLTQLKADILSGKISEDNLCKLVPDIQKIDGEFVEKGVPVTAPEEDAEKPEEVNMSPISVVELQSTTNSFKETLEAQKVTIDLKNGFIVSRSNNEQELDQLKININSE